MAPSAAIRAAPQLAERGGMKRQPEVLDHEGYVTRGSPEQSNQGASAFRWRRTGRAIASGTAGRDRTALDRVGNRFGSGFAV